MRQAPNKKIAQSRGAARADWGGERGGPPSVVCSLAYCLASPPPEAAGGGAEGGEPSDPGDATKNDTGGVSAVFGLQSKDT